MICFQFWVSLTSLSFSARGWTNWRMLWFAFNFEYLWHRYHYRADRELLPRGCDLLSILSIFDIAIISTEGEAEDELVVICFQFWVSLTSLSFIELRTHIKGRLWFAFNFEYLWHRYHYVNDGVRRESSCDLLSILSIFDIAIIESKSHEVLILVVICFQFWVSLTSLSFAHAF